MHYYSFHIGDYRAATAHLTNEEDLAYRRLIDMYYDTEQPIPTDLVWVARRLRVSIDAVKSVLQDMFFLTEEGWDNERCSEELKGYRRMKQGGRDGAAKRWAKGDDTPPIDTPNTPQCQPVTNNHKPVTNNQINTNAEALDGFDEFWKIYDKKIEKPQAEKSWKRIKPSVELQLTIYAAARKYVQSTPDKKYRKNPSTWLNNQCWNDEVVAETQQKKVGFFGTMMNFGESQNEQLPSPITPRLDG